MNVNIVIPNYNGENLLKKNLLKVFEAAEFYIQKTNEELSIVVVDDASTDSSIGYINHFASGIRHKNIQIKILENKKNLGFAATVNKGVKEANGDIIVLLNSDVIPEKDFLEPLLKHFTDEKVFAVGCVDKSLENSKTVLRGRGTGRFEKGFLVHARGEINNTNTLWVNGGSGAFRKSMWDRLSGFNSLYKPFYWEDIDLSYRALKSGYEILFEPKSIVIHEHEKGAIKTKYSPQEVKVIAYKNQFLFVWLNITDMDLLLEHVFWLPYHFLSMLYKRELAFFLGFFKAFSLLPFVIAARFRNKMLFKKGDKEILRNYLKTQPHNQI